jgi:catechol 2,3-dioxygenase-like lactoylglutathione lyase family enzyme
MQRFHPIHLALASTMMLCACTSAVFGKELPTTVAGPLQDRGFAQIGIHVRDLDRGIVFYRDVLGLRLLFVTNGMAFFQAANTRLLVEQGEPSRSATLYFNDADLERDKPALEAKGIIFAGPVETVQRTAAYDLKLLEFADPDGNPLALMGEVPRTAGGLE